MQSLYPSDYFTVILPALTELYALERHYDNLIWDSQDRSLSVHYVLMKQAVRSVIDGHFQITTNPQA
jgi:hypothetical protein